MERPRFLVIEDDPATARGLARIVSGYGEAFVSATAREAERLLESSSNWSAILVDLGLPDGSGLDVLAHARGANALTPIMVLTGCTEAATINAAHDLGAHYVVKPVESDRIARFVAGAIKIPVTSHRALEALAAQYGLSEAEVDILRRAATGEDREWMARARGSSILTVKKQIANMLAKTGSASFQALVVRCLRHS